MTLQQRMIDPKDVWTPPDVFPNADFPFGVRYADPQTPHPLHMHRGFSELTVIYRGEGVHFTEEEEYRVRAGDVFVITGNLRHGYKDLEGLCLRNICFDAERILVQTDHVRKLSGYHVLFSLEPKYRRKHKFESRLHLNPDELTHIMSLIRVIEGELEEELPGYEYTVIALFMQAVSYLCRCYSHATHPRSRSLMRMASVISYIETNYAETIELRELQEIAHLSASALLKNFREATGLSPIEYLLRVRISRAIEMLRDESASITDAAMAVGFSDSNYFARQFRRIMQMTPSDYREQMRLLGQPLRPQGFSLEQAEAETPTEIKW